MRALVWVLLAVGCVQTSSIECAGGLVCPSGTQCATLASRGTQVCAEPADLAACTGISDGTACLTNGDCLDGVCLHHCGDGIRSGAEECDGSDLGSNASCTDLGYYVATPLVCSPACTYDVVGDYSAGCTGKCHDGVVNGPELCEDSLGWQDPRTCLDFGLDAGEMTCAQCGPSFADCKQIGLVPKLVAVDGPIAGRAADDLWTVSNGIAYHFDGQNWTPMPLPGDPQYIGLSVDASGHAWAAGTMGDVTIGGTPQIAYWDGTAWSAVPVTAGGVLYGIWAPGNGEAWAVGRDLSLQGMIIHVVAGNGSVVTIPSVSTLLAIWGSAANDIWAVGDSGTILHYNGSSWQVATSPLVSGESISAMYGSAANDVWAVGSTASGAGVVIHNGGSGWTQVTVPTANGQMLDAVWTDGTHVWAGGYHVLLRYDGELWVPLVNDMQVAGIWGSAAADVWISGVSSTRGSETDHYTGASWGAWDLGAGNTVQAVWFDGSSVWAAPYGTTNAIERFHDGAWTTTSEVFQGANVHLFATGPNDVWASLDVLNGSVPNGEIDHWNGSSWAPSKTFASLPTPSAMWGTGPTDVWAVGLGVGILHYDGTWTQVDAISTMRAMWGTSTTDVWVGGFDGEVRHYDGASWTISRTGVQGDEIYGMWAAAPNDVWAVGTAIFHYDGTTWTKSHPTVNGYSSVFGTSANDVFVVGYGEVVLHWDGVAWTPVRASYGSTSSASSLWAGAGHVLMGLANSTQVVDLVRESTW